MPEKNQKAAESVETVRRVER